MAVTNLTNTKWAINSTTCTAGYGQFNINYNIYDNGAGVPIGQDSQLFVGYRWVHQQESFVPQADVVMSPMSIAVIQVGMTIEIGGGNDATNTSLISWLEANATQVPMTTSIIIGENILLGVDTIKVTESNNPSNYAEFVYGNVPTTTTSIKIGGNTLAGVNQINVLGTDSTYKSFGYKEQASTISFTIDTYTYQADSGMTWYEWCNSAYNTAELTTENTSSAWVYSDGGNYVGYVDDVSVIVKGTDTIISGKHYIMMGGAPND